MIAAFSMKKNAAHSHFLKSNLKRAVHDDSFISIKEVITTWKEIRTIYYGLYRK